MTDHIMVPIAAGELYDKLSILEIKLERITDAFKLANVKVEFELLRRIALVLPGSNDEEVVALRRELKTVNEAIWDAENVVRKIARAAGTLGEDFAAVARLTYSNNDRRAAIKRNLSLLSGSLLLEEKSHADESASSVRQ